MSDPILIGEITVTRSRTGVVTLSATAGGPRVILGAEQGEALADLLATPGPWTRTLLNDGKVVLNLSTAET